MIPKVERKQKQKWMTEEILEMLKERRKFKDRNENRYNEINHQIKPNVKKQRNNG